MFKLDNNLLIELGLGSLPAHEKNQLLQHIYDTLEVRVGMRLAEQMSDQQLQEFESFVKGGDEAGALKWLETNFPNYKDVVGQELEKLKTEIKGYAPQIVASSQQAQAQAAAQAQQMPMGAGAPMQPGYGYPQPAPQPMPGQYQPPRPAYGAQAMPGQAPVQQPQTGAYQQPVQPQYGAPMQPPYGQPQPMQSQPQPMPVQPQYAAPQPMPQWQPTQPAAATDTASTPSGAADPISTAQPASSSDDSLATAPLPSAQPYAPVPFPPAPAASQQGNAVLEDDSRS